MADTSLASIVRSTAGLDEIMAKSIAKNSKKTTRRATSAICTIFRELDKSKRTLSKINLTSMKVSMF